ncbi:hypothetical protein SAMN05443429_103109 [Cruoricaptor ignavus]|uniref:Uncharacterized protein n=1 Tax=Cruoricaptor ignavus TaxID=1118202 RepID=A0A1M6D4D6_9FLAO|nr:hypothetical protein SAMN05443429_103109 [Cruoricaptor ignavus]
MFRVFIFLQKFKQKSVPCFKRHGLIIQIEKNYFLSEVL